MIPLWQSGLCQFLGAKVTSDNLSNLPNLWILGFAKLAFGGIGTLETARTASVHSLPCTQEKGIYEPTRTRLFSFLEHEVERRRKDSGQRVHL